METTEIFQLLAAKVLESVDRVPTWQSAALKIKRLEKNVGFESYYLSETGEQVDVDTSVNYQTAKAVHNLYDITQNHPLPHKNWNRAIFTLFPDNKFDIEYMWDQELQDRVDGFNS